MFLAALPGYARQPCPGKRSSRTKDEVLLGFEDFTTQLLAWTLWWNTEHRPAPLRGWTPLQAWQDDPTPLRDVPAADLWTFTLEDAGTRTLTTRGIRFRRRDYVGPWMTGQTGIQVRVRFMPHHDHRIEVYHAATGRYLGPADLADQNRSAPYEGRGPLAHAARLSPLPAHQLPGPLPVQHQGQRPRPGPASLPRPRRR
ncbi:Mu transposase C-terminal domain-containing protein [Streptomyces sp. NPDC004596]